MRKETFCSSLPPPRSQIEIQNSKFKTATHLNSGTPWYAKGTPSAARLQHVPPTPSITRWRAPPGTPRGTLPIRFLVRLKAQKNLDKHGLGTLGRLNYPPMCARHIWFLCSAPSTFHISRLPRSATLAVRLLASLSSQPCSYLTL